MIHITDDQFFAEYKPIYEDENNETCKDFHNGNPEDWKKVLKANEEKRAWTLIDADGHLWLSSGLHYVNRVAVFITEIPYSEEIEIDWES